jgi:hypothetical protein
VLPVIGLVLVFPVMQKVNNKCDYGDGQKDCPKTDLILGKLLGKRVLKNIDELSELLDLLAVNYGDFNLILTRPINVLKIGQLGLAPKDLS